MSIIQEVDIYLNQGASFSKVINLKDSTTGANSNIVGYSANSSLKRSFYSQNISANMTCVVTNATNGEITISMTYANTSNLKPGVYLYDVLVNKPDSTKERILQGKAFILPGVTDVDNS